MASGSEDADAEPTQAAREQGTTQALSEESTPLTHVPRFWLRVTTGPDSDATFTSQGERCVLGTHESADFVLKDQAVSRFHCAIEPSGARMTIRDLGSKNGTIVNQISVRDADLRHGATLTLGRTELRFELRPDAVSLPLSKRHAFGTMVGRSVPIRRAFALLERAAESDVTVLLEGETGTGKESAAESIHLESARRDRPFLVIDCGAIPPNLLESELFGHEKGAFTGAAHAREGAFEAASGGTIFLDEIGELDIELQPKLLRVLERREVKRIGSNRSVPVDVRIVAATNRNLMAAVNERRFRSDLFYRLAVVTVRLPPLRERSEDLPSLVAYLFGMLRASDRPVAVELLEDGFLRTLAQHSWPGNVRELRNYLERCIVLRETVPLLDEPGQQDSAMPDLSLPLKAARERCNRSFERQYAQEMLLRHEGNVTSAAREAGVDRMYFYRLLWRHGLR